MSSIEVECMALDNVMTNIIWIKELLISFPTPQIFLYDNLSIMFLVTNPILHSKIKHVEFDIYFVHEKMLEKQLLVQYISSVEPPIDLFPKPLSTSQFIHLRNKLRIFIQPRRLKGGFIVDEKTPNIMKLME